MKLYDKPIDGEPKLVVEGDDYELIFTPDGELETIYEQRGSSYHIIVDEQLPTEVLAEAKRLVKSHI